MDNMVLFNHKTLIVEGGSSNIKLETQYKNQGIEPFMLLPPLQIIGRFGLSRFIDVCMHLDTVRKENLFCRLSASSVCIDCYSSLLMHN